jgi:hypothetical protein
MNEDSLQVLTEFCEHHPEMLKRIRYKKIATYDEPIPILDPVALETFRVWEIHREYTAAQPTLLGRMMWLLRQVWMRRPLGRINLFPGVVFPRVWRRP